MTKTFKPGRGYSQKDWDEVSDNPVWTKSGFAKAVPFKEAFPALAANMKKAGRPKKDNPKLAISIRLDAEVIDKFKATGPGWQTRMNSALRRAKV